MPKLSRMIDSGDAGSRARLARSTAIFSLATGLSRLLGLAREIVAAAAFGVEGKINAFTVAFQIPNLVRALVADAALSGAFVPVFSELLERGERARAWRVASTILWLLLLAHECADGAVRTRGALRDRPLRRPGRRRRPRRRPLAGALPDRRLARPLRRRRRNPEQLRPVHGAGADTRRLEPRHHPRPRPRRPGCGRRGRGAVRLRRFDRRRDGRAAAAAASLAPRARRPAAPRARLARPGSPPVLHADAARDDHARADQRQHRDRDALRLAADRPGAWRRPRSTRRSASTCCRRGCSRSPSRRSCFRRCRGWRRAATCPAFARTVDLGVRQIAFLLVPAGVVSAVLAEPIVRLVYERGEFTPDADAGRRGRSGRVLGRPRLQRLDADAQPRLLRACS